MYLRSLVLYLLVLFFWVESTSAAKSQHKIIQKNYKHSVKHKKSNQKQLTTKDLEKSHISKIKDITNTYPSLDVTNIKDTFQDPAVRIAEEFDLLHQDAKNIEKISEDDIEVTAENISVSKNGSTDMIGSGNIRTNGMLANFESGSLISDGDKSFLLNLKKDVRINSENENVIYAKSVLYDNNEALHMQNVRIINNGAISLIAKDITNYKKDVLLLREGFYTSCNITPEETDEMQNYLDRAPQIVTDSIDWEINKKNANLKKNYYQNSLINKILKIKNTTIIDYDTIPKNDKYKALEEDFDSIYNKYKFSEWRLNIKKALYNKVTGKATFYNTTLRIFNLPVFYLPRYTINLKDMSEAKTGLLFPELTFPGGGSQVGLAIPWYWRISHNKDLLIRANVFFNIGDMLGNSPPANTTFDNRRIMSDYLFFAYNHLISKDKGVMSHYSIKGSITNETQMIDYNTKQAIFGTNGSYQKGYRGHFRFKGIFSLSQTTVVNARYLYISDPQYTLWYLRKFVPYHTNNLSIHDTRDRSYNKLELITWTPMFLNYQIETTPAVVTQGRSYFRTKQNSVGGYGFIDNRASYISRAAGYSRGMLSSEFGYNNTNIILGTKISFDNSIRVNGYHNQFNNSLLLDPGFSTNNQNIILFGSYANVLQSNQYIPAGYLGSSLGSLVAGSSQIVLNHPLYKTFKHGTLIIDPIVSWQNNYGSGYGLLTNEDSFTSRLSFSNLFEKNITNGVDGFVNGSRVSFGLKTKFITTSGYIIEVAGGIMNTIASFGNTFFLQDSSGIYSNGLSNYVGSVSFSTSNNRVSIVNNHRVNIENGKLLESYTNLNIKVIDKFLDVNIGHFFADKNVLFIQKMQPFDIQMINIGLVAHITENLDFEFRGSQIIGDTNIVYFNRNTQMFQVVSGKDFWTFANININYRSGCIDYGFNMSKAVLSGTDDFWYFGFNVQFSGI